MIITKREVYDKNLSQKDLASLDNVIHMLYQFQSNKEAWADIEEAVRGKSINIDIMSLQQMITILTEIGGEDYQKMIKKVRSFSAVS